MTPSKTRRKYVAIRALGIIALLIVTLSSTVSAETIPSIDSITTNPATPVAGQPFSVSIHVLNPPINGFIYASIGSFEGEVTIDSTGVAVINNVIINDPGNYALDVSVCEPIPGLPMYSVTFEQQSNIAIQDPSSIPEFPSVAVPLIAILGLVAIIGRRKDNW